MIKSAAMPDKTAIQKRGNCWIPRWPIPSVLDVDEPCISEFQYLARQPAAHAASNHRPGESECPPLRIAAK